jgi:hypothetical protein
VCRAREGGFVMVTFQVGVSNAQIAIKNTTRYTLLPSYKRSICSLHARLRHVLAPLARIL